MSDSLSSVFYREIAVARKAGSDGSDTALFNLIRNKFKSTPTARGPARGTTAGVKQPKTTTPARTARGATKAEPRGVVVASGKVADVMRAPAPKAKAPAPKAKAPAPKATAAPAPKATAAPAPKTKVTVREARPAYTDVSPPPRKSGKSEYVVYEKKSSEAQSFRDAFAAARKGGAKTFTWQGRKYTTEVKKG